MEMIRSKTTRFEEEEAAIVSPLLDTYDNSGLSGLIPQDSIKRALCTPKPAQQLLPAPSSSNFWNSGEAFASFGLTRRFPTPSRRG